MLDVYEHLSRVVSNPAFRTLIIFFLLTLQAYGSVLLPKLSFFFTLY